MSWQGLGAEGFHKHAGSTGILAQVSTFLWQPDGVAVTGCAKQFSYEGQGNLAAIICQIIFAKY